MNLSVQRQRFRSYELGSVRKEFLNRESWERELALTKLKQPPPPSTNILAEKINKGAGGGIVLKKLKYFA